MARPYLQYAREIKEGLFYGGTWPPGTPLELGQIGTFEDGIFVPKGHISTLGLPFEEVVDSKSTTYIYTSKGAVSLTFKAKGQPTNLFKYLTDAQAGVRISFSRSDAVVFSAAECRENRIANILALEEELKRYLVQGKWNERWAVITHLVKAQSATILLSASSNTVVELAGTIGGSVGPTQIADISASVALAYGDQMNQLVVAKKGLTPLYHSLRVKPDFWSGQPRTLLDRGLGGSSMTDFRDRAPHELFEQVDYDAESIQNLTAETGGE